MKNEKDNEKKFDKWSALKKKLDVTSSLAPLFSEGDIWWCSVGENIKSEMSGKSSLFTRPVLVIKKLSRDIFIGVPLTSKPKTGSWYVKITHGGNTSYAILSQVRSYSAHRFSTVMNQLDESDFEKVKTSLVNLLLQKIFLKNRPPEIPERTESIPQAENPTIAIGQIYKHSKRGTLYKIVDIIPFQCSSYLDFDNKNIVVYSPIDDETKKWSRLEEEFSEKIAVDDVVMNRFSLVH